MKVIKRIDFTVADFGVEIAVDVNIWDDGVVVVNAEVPDPIMRYTESLEELIIAEDGKMPSVNDITEAIDAEYERRYDAWCERQAAY